MIRRVPSGWPEIYETIFSCWRYIIYIPCPDNSHPVTHVNASGFLTIQLY
jgi:hypothetical protein